MLCESVSMAVRSYNVLFLCTHNSARRRWEGTVTGNPRVKNRFRPVRPKAVVRRHQPSINEPATRYCAIPV